MLGLSLFLETKLANKKIKETQRRNKIWFPLFCFSTFEFWALKWPENSVKIHYLDISSFSRLVIHHVHGFSERLRNVFFFVLGMVLRSFEIRLTLHVPQVHGTNCLWALILKGVNFKQIQGLLIQLWWSLKLKFEVECNAYNLKMQSTYPFFHLEIWRKIIAKHWMAWG